MKNFWLKIEKFVNTILSKKLSVFDWVLSFSGIILVRLFIDNFVAKSEGFSADLILDIHNLLFFLALITLCWLVLSFFIQKNPLELAYLMIFGSIFIIFPPILDILKTGGSVYWSVYLLSDIKTLFLQFVTIFGYLPSGVVYFGTKWVFIGALILCSLVVFVKTKNAFRALLSFICLYCVLFFMAAIPSFVAYIYYFFEGRRNIQDINSVKIIEIVAVPDKIFNLKEISVFAAMSYNLNFILFLFILAILYGFFYFSDRDKLFSFLRNLRITQVFYSLGLFFIGMGVGFWAYPQSLTFNLFTALALLSLSLSIFLAWEASVVANDIFDQDIDQVSNSKRPLPKFVFGVSQYKTFGIMLFILSLIGGLIVDIKFFYLLLVYQVLAYFYSCFPFRFKRFPIIASFISGIASLIIIFMGFSLFSGDQNVNIFPWRIIALLLVSFTLSLPIKDFKDIEGDSKNGIWTIPVIFGEEKGRLIVATGVFISFISSVFFLNEMRLFWWALIFGAGAFLLVVDKKIKPRSLPWWIFGAVFCYGLILVKTIFF